MNKIKKVVKLAKSLGSSFPLQDNYTLVKVSSQLPPYSDLARGVSSLDHYEVRHPYSDDVIGALTVWSAKRIPSVVKLGVFQDAHKSIGLIESLHDKIKEIYPNIPEDLLSYMYTIWGGVSANKLFHDTLHPSLQLKFHEIFSALKRAPLRKSDDNNGFHNHLDYHIYQDNEHVGTLSGKELNAMMPSKQHREQTEKEKNFVFHATNFVTGNPAVFMKKSNELPKNDWMVKLVGSEEYHPLHDIKDSKLPIESGGGNIYYIKRPDGSVTEHHQSEVEDLKHNNELQQSTPVFMRD